MDAYAYTQTHIHTHRTRYPHSCKAFPTSRESRWWAFAFFLSNSSERSCFLALRDFEIRPRDFPSHRWKEEERALSPCVNFLTAFKDDICAILRIIASERAFPLTNFALDIPIDRAWLLLDAPVKLKIQSQSQCLKCYKTNPCIWNCYWPACRSPRDASSPARQIVTLVECCLAETKV